MSDPSSEYTRSLYARSPKFRLARINHSRKRQGRPLIASLDQIRLRIPVAE